MKDITCTKILNLLNTKKPPHQKFVYQLLDRCLQDCKYFVDVCRNPAFLWGKTVDAHIRAMRLFYDYLYEKPIWINTSMIDYYELSMKYGVGDSFESDKLGFSGTIKVVAIDVQNRRATIMVKSDRGEDNIFFVGNTDI